MIGAVLPLSLILKFILSEKATKFCEISTVDLPVKSKVEISQNVLAFSEYMNFNSLAMDVSNPMVQVDELRSKELTSIRMFLTLQALQNFIWNCAVFLVAFTSFSTYSLFISDSLSVETTFVSLALLNALRGSFRYHPYIT